MIPKLKVSLWKWIIIGYIVLAIEAEDTHPLKVANLRSKGTNWQKEQLCGGKPDDESYKINASAVAKKNELEREIDDGKTNPH